jgi:hypothetical protein
MEHCRLDTWLDTALSAVRLCFIIIIIIIIIIMQMMLQIIFSPLYGIYTTMYEN